MENKILPPINKFIKQNINRINAPSSNLPSIGEFIKQGTTSTLPSAVSSNLPPIDKFIKQEATIAPQTTTPQTTKTLEAPKSKFKMATQVMGHTLSSILGVVSLPETIGGGIMESELSKGPVTREEIKTKPNPFTPSGFLYYSPLGGGTPKYVAKKAWETLKGNLGEIGTQKGIVKGAELLKQGEPLTEGQHIGATAASILLDIGISPLTYLTFGGSSLLKIGEKGAEAGLTKAGTKAFATIVKSGVEKGLTREVAVEAAKVSMEEALKAGGKTAKLFSKGGIRFAEWIPKVGGESILPYESISKFVEPVAKYTGLSKVYKGLKNWEMTKAITKAVSPTAGVPEELYKFGRKAQALREYNTLKETEKYIKPLKDLGKFSSGEAENIFNAIRNPEIYGSAPDKIKKAADIIGQRFTDIRKGLVDRGIDIGYLDRYAPQLYADNFGKEFADNIKNFATELPQGATKIIMGDKITIGATKRGKEFFEYPRMLFETVEAAEAAGFKVKKNIFDLLGSYEAGANRINSFMDIVEKIKPVGIDLTKEKMPAGFIKGSGLLENYAFPKDVANYMGSFQKTFFNNAELKTFLKYYDNAMRYWKTMATVVSPGFHVRNFLSNIFNSWLGGNKNPLNYLDAAKVFKGTGEVATQAGEKVAGSTVLEEAMKRGVVGRGWFGYGGELGGKKLAQELQPVYKTVLKGINPLGAESYLARAGRKFGVTVEDYSRLAHFIDVFKKTGDFNTAAEEAFKYLFDYSELTPFWKNVMNRAMPFGTWLRKNTALQFEQLIKQPGKYAAIPEVKKFIESFSESTKPDETYLPEYLKKELAIRLPVKDSQGNFIYARLDLPYLGISDVSDWRTLMGSITPAVKIPTELGFGKELFTGKNIEVYPGYTAEVPGYIGILPDWIKKRLGVVRAKNPKTGKIEERMNPYAAYILRQNPLMSKIGKLIPYPEQTQYQSSSRPYSAASILGGIGITPYDVGYRKKVYEKEQKALMNTYQKRMQELKKWK